MKKTLPLIISLCCVGANATSANYDLLGRKGSKMNSPMVYKNFDYSKVKKNEQQKVGSSLENRALAKSGMPNTVGAVEALYWSSLTSNPGFATIPYYFRSIDNYGNPIFSGYCDWPNYKYRWREVFGASYDIIEVNQSGTSSDPNHPMDDRYTLSFDGNIPWTYYNYTLFAENSPETYYLSEVSPYNSNQRIRYDKTIQQVKGNSSLSGANNVQNWYDSKASDVGVYLSVDARPVKTSWSFDPEYIKYDLNEWNGGFIDNYGHEVRDSRALNLVNFASRHSVPYVGKKTNPSNLTSTYPQIYIGVRNNKMSSSGSSNYDAAAKALDNFIYTKRTIEFVPAGNTGDGNGKLTSQAHAANAITVGAVDVNNKNVTSYTSTVTHSRGSQKPEIYNYVHFRRTNERARTYTRTNGNQKTFQPFYNGTEMAAAYTAGMVSDLLAVNPFYRWHPEVVKALLLTSSGNSISQYPDGAVTTTTPSYEYLVFDDIGSKPKYEYLSRYWNGDINKLRNHEVNGMKEIWFVIPNYPGKSMKAAISWLNYGDDIANLGGQIPQDFDLYVIGSYSPELITDNDMNVNDSHRIKKSDSSYDSFEKVEFNSGNLPYLKFCIRLHHDSSASERNGQIILGFNLAVTK